MAEQLERPGRSPGSSRRQRRAAAPVALPLHDIIADGAATALWEWDPEADSLRWHDPIRRLIGLQHAPAADVDAALRQLLAPLLAAPAHAPEGSVTLENTLRLPRRAYRHYRIHARWLDATPARRLAGSVTDISNERLDTAPAEAADRYRLLVELSPDAIVVHCDGHIVFANRAAAVLVGAGVSAELLGRPMLDFVAPESRDAVRRRIAGLKENDTHTEPAEALLRRLDGSTVAVQSVAVRTQWEDKPAFQVILRNLTAQKAAEASLRLQAELIAHVSDAIIGTDVAGRITSWNPAAAALYGWTAGEVLGRPVHEVLIDPHADPRDTATAYGIRAELTHVHRDGTPLHLLVAAAEIKGPNGAVTGTVIISSDLSERRKAERIRRQADARYSAAVAALDEGLLIIGADGVIETANPAAIDLLGGIDAVGIHFDDAVTLSDDDGHPLDPAGVGLDETRLTGVPHPPFTAAVRRPGRRTTYLSVSVRALPTESGAGPYPVVMCLLDVTERHAAAAQLRYEAQHDSMTGLANRSLVLQSIDDLLGRRDRSVGVLFLDLDRFKMVNDSLGHEAGDAVLRTIAARITAVVQPHHIVGRLAGDEFVVVVADACEGQLQTIAAELIDLLCQPVRMAGRDIVVTCSVGIAVTPAGAHRQVTASELVRDADAAMYYAKQHGRNRHATFDARFRRRAVDRLELEEDLRKGLGRGELAPAYQPVVSLRTSRTIAVEALARWKHPRRGEVSPTVFIPVAEESGLIAPLGEVMLEQSVRDLARWRRGSGVPQLGMSVNLSPRQLADPSVADRVKALLERHELAPYALNLEITESALMDDPELAAATLTRLRNLGVLVSIDDFGTGYSSLSYLRRFPVTSVKIDRSFVERLGQSRDDEAIIAGIVNLSHTLGLKTCAEGVERPAQLRTLSDLGCDYAQGYLLSKPLRAEELTPLLQTAYLPGDRWYASAAEDA